ncbi:uncharacterized protein [Parasteatoda tepidariorum]|uniref:uncharacterized protein n=1 Tax=Parasteatoda tepidariorum TaxID=114398 RepID=UPI001C7265F4|nr:uncharacterized protein LOC107447074 [Parasteatoda tepidariorum]XP_042906874.1 uncharacterized protein LOC107447074 [Parasteatoda tepidariorum]XP_042906875.1 uncharacterized protein LOC107447074 [Parasteatoda tepidariorum]
MKFGAIGFFLLLLLASVSCSYWHKEGRELEENIEKCAKEDESCSKLMLGEGPKHCCPPKGCSCDLEEKECGCYYDRIDITFGKDWEKLRDIINEEYEDQYVEYEDKVNHFVYLVHKTTDKD